MVYIYKILGLLILMFWMIRYNAEKIEYTGLIVGCACLVISHVREAIDEIEKRS